MNRYKNLGIAETIGELKKLLEQVPDDFEWNGRDDGSICIYGPNGEFLSIGNRDSKS